MGESNYQASVAVREQIHGQGHLSRRDDPDDSKHVAGAVGFLLRETRSGRNRTRSSCLPFDSPFDPLV